ncbi:MULTISPECIES: hypothetical protein [unclassified Actinopolyspora]|uniref:hypothetical protein n=1 Tax=unclassified Actinopolyspora TaxID=2639451 RepID=UPI0013F5E891|nr:MULTISPECIES: hypothetical protein [unclassified Actinopolyspora]NHD15672.1 hypothetical protein [Actinopolyspora sp. BKK2]NHE75114.1 hypothetical protein [Actinopolyspora sp. BKK1]
MSMWLLFLQGVFMLMLARRLSVAMASGLFALLALGVAPAVAQTSGQGSANLNPASQNISYNCIIPEFGWADQCQTFWVQPGQRVEISLDDSGGKRIDVNLNDIGTGQQYNGTTLNLNEGDSRIIWTNGYDNARKVRMAMASPAVVTIQALGNVSIY